MKRQYWEEILIAFSLANLLFIGGWRKLIYPNSDVYHIKEMPSSLDYLSLISLVILVGGILFGGFWLFRYLSDGKFSVLPKLIFLFALLCVINAFRITFYEYQLIVVEALGYKTFLVLIALIVFLGLLKLKGKIFSYARQFVLALSPFLLITVFQTVLGISSTSTELQNSISYTSETEREDTEIKSRVIWIIFDEFDYKIPFETRPENLQLPEFDKLEKESIMATNATSPAYETLQSMPALLTGKIVEKAVPISKNELAIKHLDDEESKYLSQESTIFSDVTKLGGKSAVVGFYHPYCRLFQKYLSACEWEGYDFAYDFKSTNLSQSLFRDFRLFLKTLPFGYRMIRYLESSNFIHHENQYEIRHNRILKNTEKVLKNKAFDLTLLHLTVPHPPFNFDHKSRKFGVGGSYADNLALTDLVLGKIRNELENAKLWDSSTIIVSSDHQWRVNLHKNTLSKIDLEFANGNEDRRIPFFVKLKNQTEPSKYDTAFNTVVTREFILNVIKGNISNSLDAKTWLDKNSDNEPQINNLLN